MLKVDEPVLLKAPAKILQHASELRVKLAELKRP
jgi:hypothetical protein